MRDITRLRPKEGFATASRHYLVMAVFCMAGVSFWLSYEFRFDFQVPEAFGHQRLVLLPYVAVLKLFLFYLFRGHVSDWRYVGLSDIPGLFLYCSACTVLLLLTSTLGKPLWVPRGVILIDFFMSIVLVGGTLISMRFVRERISRLFRRTRRSASKQAVVIGAGDAGEMIIREIGRNPGSGLHVLALFDDDVSKRGSFIHGIRVVGSAEDVPSFIMQNPVDVAIIAIPSANRAEMKRIYQLLKDLNISVKTLPGIAEIIEGSATLTQLRDISIADLLGREEIQIDTQSVSNLVFDKVVMVTGAGGSIGCELSRQIFRRKPRRLILLDRSENNLFHIHRELSEYRSGDPYSELTPLLCDARDVARMTSEFEKLKPDLVFHAAAHKHVPLQELNAAECFKNNVGTTQVLARLADRFGVSRFLLISTDKAVNPTSVMGASKRVCELYCQAYAATSRTKFLSVRFGNVLASDGSVVPIFLEQITKGGPITVTHPEMRRYFMTIPEAVTLVLQAATLGRSGQIMVLEMGEPIKIVDLVHQLVQLVGREQEAIPIRYIGMRPGEKLFEEVSCNDEVCMATSHRKIKVYHGQAVSPDVIADIDRALETIDQQHDELVVRRVLKSFVPEYNPDAHNDVISHGVMHSDLRH
jgi:FlaA1/EpsC-like NDP-sugar epimerase